jgi:pyruvate/2-oxoglutarate dehydrogenase complex dihydrolipoamide dehydrogenase (E3) component
MTTSEELMETEKLPEKVIFIGGGYIFLRVRSCCTKDRDRSSWNSSRRAGTEFAASNVIIDEANDHIMGAHILGSNAEAINIFAALMRLGLKASDIKKMVFSYPTTCSDIPYIL